MPLHSTVTDSNTAKVWVRLCDSESLTESLTVWGWANTEHLIDWMNETETETRPFIRSEFESTWWTDKWQLTSWLQQEILHQSMRMNQGLLPAGCCWTDWHSWYVRWELLRLSAGRLGSWDLPGKQSWLEYSFTFFTCLLIWIIWMFIPCLFRMNEGYPIQVERKGRNRKKRRRLEGSARPSLRLWLEGECLSVWVFGSHWVVVQQLVLVDRSRWVSSCS